MGGKVPESGAGAMAPGGRNAPQLERFPVGRGNSGGEMQHLTPFVSSGNVLHSTSLFTPAARQAALLRVLSRTEENDRG